MRENLEGTLAALPRKPGVYVFRDEQGEPLYVGKAKSLRSRVRSYFQRGNGRAGINAMIALDLATVLRALRDGVVSPAAVIGIRRHELGDANGVRLCFSDATALPGAGVLFTAVAEGGDDTYLDGRCTGAAVGLLTPVGDLDWIRPLDPPAKVEGIEAHRTGAGTELLLVADPDDPDSPAPLLTALLAP